MSALILTDAEIETSWRRFIVSDPSKTPLAALRAIEAAVLAKCVGPWSEYPMVAEHDAREREREAFKQGQLAERAGHPPRVAVDFAYPSLSSAPAEKDLYWRCPRCDQTFYAEYRITHEHRCDRQLAQIQSDLRTVAKACLNILDGNGSWESEVQRIAEGKPV